ncbi:hypothetical protein JQX13_47600 [Archangium violaceum]|uniref:hypothetical protein n=1 Tax=Archangium violaceum TaxID=83451 RepID=UPI00193B9110|nr:hypothetical protein [Archangium violaceum]QRK07586.1 hypothetical protein JQX13_47600 [Archangium violaceum]
MKVDGHNEAAPARPASDKKRFQEALKKTPPNAVKTPARGGPTPRTSLAPTRAATATVATNGLARTPRQGAFASAEHLGQVRQGLNVEAHRLREVRGEAQQANQEQVRQRVTDLIARELTREPSAEPVAPHAPLPSPTQETRPTTPPLEAAALSGATGPGGASAGAVETQSSEARVQATLELIEKIDVFVKSQRPALAMRLGGSLDATVEVERTGEREVALRIQGRRGPLPQKELARIRGALAERGLKLSAFHSS